MSGRRPFLLRLGVVVVVVLVGVPLASAERLGDGETGSRQAPGDGSSQPCFNPPHNSNPPSVWGPNPANPGDTLTTGGDTWVHESTSDCGDFWVEYSWFRAGFHVGSGPSYVVAEADRGSYITSQARGCQAGIGCTTANSSNSIGVNELPPPPPNDSPYEPSSVLPAEGAIVNEQIPQMSAIFSDPNGDSGRVRFWIYDWEGQLRAFGDGSTVGSGGRSVFCCYSQLPRGGWFSVDAQAIDSHGAGSDVVWATDFAIDAAPQTPVLQSPPAWVDATTTVPTTEPTLKATITDPDTSAVYSHWQVHSNSGCSSLVDSATLYDSGTFRPAPGKLKDGEAYWWRVQAEDNWGLTSAWSECRKLEVHLPKLGLRDIWPMWSRGPLAVNQATGNLVLTLPGPSYPAAGGALGIGVSYNSLARDSDQGLGSRWLLDTAGAFAGVPARLVDHNLPTGADKFDAIERVSGDGSSDFYSHVGSSNTYLAAPGDGSQLTKNADGTWTLIDPDGAMYSFGATATNAAYPLLSAEFLDAGPNKTNLSYCLTNGKLSSIRDGDCDGDPAPTRQLTLSWAGGAGCTDALLCVTGPDARTWKYIGESGTGGRLARVHNGTRTLLEISYGANGRPSTVRNANDLDPAAAHPDYLATHALTLGYDTGNRVTSVSDGPIRNQTPATSIWSFEYLSGGNAPATAHAHEGTPVGTARPARGHTKLTPPRQQGLGANAKRVTSYYDNRGRTIAVVDQFGNVTQSAHGERDQLLWGEDEEGNPTDYTYTAIDGSASTNAAVETFLTSVTGPDPDGAGPLARPVTRYRYDETLLPETSGALTLTGEVLTDRGRANGQPGANLLANDGFEVDAGGWGGWRASVARSTTVARYGAASLRVTPTEASEFAAYSWTGVSGATAGRAFTGSTWVYLPAGSGLIGDELACIVKEEGGSTGTLNAAYVTHTLTVGWQELSCTGTVSANDRTTISLHLYAPPAAIYAPGDLLYLDGARIWEGRLTPRQGEGRPLPDSSFGLWEGTTNLITSSGAETNVAPWGVWNASVTRTLEEQKFGRASVKLVSNDGVNGFVGMASSTIGGATAGRTFTASIWVKPPPAWVGKQVDVAIREAGGASAYQDTLRTYTLAAGWQRLSVTRTLAMNDRNDLKVLVAAPWREYPYSSSDHLFLDAAQVEEQPVATPYVHTDGASASRAGGRLQAPANVLNATQGWVALRLRPGWSAPREPYGGTGTPMLFSWRNGSANAIEGSYREAGDVFVTERVGGGQAASAVVAGSDGAVGEEKTLVFAWTASQVKVSANGSAFATQAQSAIPSGLPALFDIGNQGGNLHIDGEVLWLATGTGTLADADARTIAAFNDETAPSWEWPAASAPSLLWTADTATYTTPGTPAGPTLRGLQASYYENEHLTGRPKLRRTDPNVDFNWAVGGPADLGRTDNFSARWSGYLEVATAGRYIFTAVADEGVRLVVDGSVAIDKWAQAGTHRSHEIQLAAGLHRISLDYRELTGAAQATLKWACASCQLAEQVIPQSALRPGWANQTSTLSPLGRVSFTHFPDPAGGKPDYTLTRQLDGSSVITSFAYDAYGRTTKKWMPRANARRTIDAGGALQGTPDDRFATTYAYYARGETAAPPGACGGGGAVNQSEQLKTTTPYGVATTTFVYDLAGRPAAKTNAAGTTCSGYDPEGRLTSTRAPGEPQATTYTYDPAGAQLTATDASGTVSSEYDEAGRLTRSRDSFGAEASFSYDSEGNMSRRLAAKGALASNPNYETTYAHDAEGRLTALTDPAGRAYGFRHDKRGNLLATQYPNGTFTWAEYNAAGWLTGLRHRHGTLTGNETQPPADTNPIAEFTYTYELEGRKTSETRSVGIAASTEQWGGATGDEPVPGDYDADPEADRAVWQPATGTWRVQGSTDVQLGQQGDKPVPADYDGNGKLERAVWRPNNGTWYIHGGATIQWGQNGDIPVPADYDGDGRADIAVWRPSTGIWYLRDQDWVHFGVNGDIPVPADYDGDGDSDIAVWRPSTAVWQIRGQDWAYFGVSGDTPVPGDYDADPADDIAIWRPSTGLWAILGHEWVGWGLNGDKPSPADYAGEGKDAVAVYRPSNGFWYLRQQTLAAQTTYRYDLLAHLSSTTLPDGTRRRYGFDPDSNRTNIDEDGTRVADYGYDPVATAGVDQLTTVTENGQQRSFQYDGDGNTTQRGTDTLTWDGWGRHNGGTFAGTTVSYGFDPAGFRRQRIAAGQTTRYLLGGLFETDPAGTIALTEIDGPAGDLAHTTGPPTSSTVSYLYYNGHGDLAATANEAGTRTNAYTYDPFGDVRTGPAATGTIERWTGRWDKKHDTTSGLVEMGVRPYDPRFGRFISVDPVDGGSANAYDYAYQDPINVYDLDGRCPFCIAVIVLGPRAAPLLILAARAARGGGPAARAARGATLRAGRQRHHQLRDQIADKLRAKGYEVATEVYRRTSHGRRYADIVFRNPRTGRTFMLEIKTGASRYSRSQRLKDDELRRLGAWANSRVIRG